MFIKYIIIFTCFCALYVFSHSALEFGSFDLIVTEFNQCKGPKRQECCDANVTITDQYKLDYNLFVKENVKTTKGKIIALAQGKEVLRLQLKNPCDHLFLRPLLHTMLNVTSDCLILKGYYHFFVDIQEVATKYYGGDFIFGKWTFKSVFYNDYCNFSCSVIQVEMVPKNKTSIKH